MKENQRSRNFKWQERIGFLFASILLFILTFIIFTEKPIEISAPIQLANATSNVEITAGNPTKNQVIFTFDGGSNSISTPQILLALAKHQVKGTFFLTGKFIEINPDIVRQIVSEGHEIFSHTYNHPYLTALSDAEIVDELRATASQLYATAKVLPQPYFRPPYGDRNLRVLDVAFREGYQSVMWTNDAKDWMESEGMTGAAVKVDILENLKPGAIYLMHLGDNITGQILDDVFTEIESRGFNVVSLTEGIK